MYKGLKGKGLQECIIYSYYILTILYIYDLGSYVVLSLSRGILVPATLAFLALPFFRTLDTYTQAINSLSTDNQQAIDIRKNIINNLYIRYQQVINHISITGGV